MRGGADHRDRTQNDQDCPDPGDDAVLDHGFHLLVPMSGEIGRITAAYVLNYAQGKDAGPAKRKSIHRPR